MIVESKLGCHDIFLQLFPQKYSFKIPKNVLFWPTKMRICPRIGGWKLTSAKLVQVPNSQKRYFHCLNS